MSEPLGNGIDTAVQLKTGDKEVLKMVDQTIDAAIAQGDIMPVMVFGRALRRQMQASGLALAKLLYRLSESWELFKAVGVDDEFVDVVYADMGIAPETTTKYVALWGAIFENPAVPIEVKESLESKPMRSLILLTAAARDEEFDWAKVVDATTPAEIREIVREHRGQQTSSKTAVTLELDLRNGQITARQGDQWRIVGVLLIKEYKQDPLVATGIDRIVNSAGIMEK